MSARTTSEAQLQRQVLDLLRHTEGWWGYKVVASPLQPAGLPDIVGSYLGYFLAIETKAPGRYKTPEDGLSKLQKSTKDSIERTGAFFVAADSVEQVRRALQVIRDTYEQDRGLRV